MKGKLFLHIAYSPVGIPTKILYRDLGDKVIRLDSYESWLRSTGKDTNGCFNCKSFRGAGCR